MVTADCPKLTTCGCCDSLPLRVPGITFTLLLALFILPNCARASVKVDWSGGRLSIRAEKAPLVQVLKEVARQTGIELRGLERLKEENISVGIVDVGLAQGLEKLLGQVDYAIITGEPAEAGSRPLTVVIFGERRSPRKTAMAGGSGSNR